MVLELRKSGRIRWICNCSECNWGIIKALAQVIIQHFSRCDVNKGRYNHDRVIRTALPEEDHLAVIPVKEIRVGCEGGPVGWDPRIEHLEPVKIGCFHGHGDGHRLVDHLQGTRGIIEPGSNNLVIIRTGEHAVIKHLAGGIGDQGPVPFQEHLGPFDGIRLVILNNDRYIEGIEITSHIGRFALDEALVRIILNKNHHFKIIGLFHEGLAHVEGLDDRLRRSGREGGQGGASCVGQHLEHHVVKFGLAIGRGIADRDLFHNGDVRREAGRIVGNHVDVGFDRDGIVFIDLGRDNVDGHGCG